MTSSDQQQLVSGRVLQAPSSSPLNCDQLYVNITSTSSSALSKTDVLSLGMSVEKLRLVKQFPLLPSGTRVAGRGSIASPYMPAVGKAAVEGPADAVFGDSDKTPVASIERIAKLPSHVLAQPQSAGDSYESPVSNAFRYCSREIFSHAKSINVIERSSSDACRDTSITGGQSWGNIKKQAAFGTGDDEMPQGFSHTGQHLEGIRPFRYLTVWFNYDYSLENSMFAIKHPRLAFIIGL